MTFIQLLNKYFDRIDPASYRRGSYIKLWTAYTRAKEDEVDNLDDFISIAEDLDLPYCAYKGLKAIIRMAEKEGFETTRSLDSIQHRENEPKKPQKYDLELEEICVALRTQPYMVGCISALALCGLRPEEMIQILEVDGDTITFLGDKEPKQIPSDVQHVVDEFVRDDYIKQLLIISGETGDLKVDRYEIIDLIQRQRNSGEFNLSVKQLRFIGGIRQLVQEGYESIHDVAERLSIRVQSLRNNIDRWVKQKSIKQETFSKIINA